MIPAQFDYKVPATLEEELAAAARPAGLGAATLGDGILDLHVGEAGDVHLAPAGAIRYERQPAAVG